MITEVALLICIVTFCKIMSLSLTWELRIFSPFQISSLHLRTKILSQFFGIGYFDSLSLNLSPEMFCCQRLFTITARCGDIFEPCFSSSAKSLESWSRTGSVGVYDLMEILPTKSILSGEFLTASIFYGLGYWYYHLEFRHHQRYQHICCPARHLPWQLHGLPA